MTDGISFNQALFDACPTGVLAVDQDIRIRWINPALEYMLDLSADELVGKDQQTLPEGLHALFETTEILHLSIDGTDERWLRRDVREINDGAQTPLKLHFYQDISGQVAAQMEREALQKQVDELTITDPLTGLANQRATLQALAAQVTRSRRYNNPLTLAVVRISDQNDPTVPLDSDRVVTVAQYLRDRLRWADTIGHYEENLFMLVLPETSESDARNLLVQIQQECRNGSLTSLGDKTAPHIGIGVVAWERGNDPHLLIRHAMEALESSSGSR